MFAARYVIGNLAKALATTTPGAATSTPSRLAPTTTVAVLGWGGAKDKMVAQYSKLYEEKGLTTIRFTPHMRGNEAGAGMANMREVSNLVEALETQLKSGKRLALHVMSLNGALALAAILVKYPHLELLKNTDGLLFDSSPTYYGGLRHNLLYSQVLDYTNSDLLKKANTLQLARYYVWKTGKMLENYVDAVQFQIYRAVGADLAPISPFYYLLKQPLPPVLSFIYSKKDYTCPHYMITAFVEQLRAGRTVDARLFEESRHVEHLRKYPQEYAQTVERFLANIEEFGRTKTATVSSDSPTPTHKSKI